MLRTRLVAVALGVACAVASAAPASAAIQPRIIGGKATMLQKWPFMAAISSSQDNVFEGFFCGGQVIADRYVLTAAHCTEEIYADGQTSVMVASDNLQKPGTILKVVGLSVHPAYDGTAIRNDIAVLKLSDSTGVTPVKLARARDGKAKRNVEVAGWGYTSNSSDAIPAQLQSVKVRTLEGRRCRKTYGSGFNPRTQVCGSSDKKKDSCNGDSGGPLIRKINGRKILIGLVSYGSSPCANASQPAVYTRVSAFRKWIAGAVAKLDKQTDPVLPQPEPDDEDLPQEEEVPVDENGDPIGEDGESYTWEDGEEGGGSVDIG